MSSPRPPSAPPTEPRAGTTAGVLSRRAAAVGVAGALLAPLVSAQQTQAQGVELPTYVLTRNDEGLFLTFSARFELPRGVEEALQKGVPLFFVAEAELFRERWYWSDRSVAAVRRTWRLAYQPLTRKYRVTFSGINQNYDNLAEAVASLSRVVNWKLADATQVSDGSSYVEFRYLLDVTQMPRPMQIGLGGLSDWTLQVERTQRLN